MSTRPIGSAMPNLKGQDAFFLTKSLTCIERSENAGQGQCLVLA